AGQVRFLRRFGIPRRIDPHERVWLTFAGVEGSADVSVNGRFLGRQSKSGEPFEFEITPLLQERNQLLVEVESITADGGLWGEVALEVRSTAFLRAIEIEPRLFEENVELHVRGEVAGTSDSTLELYVLLDRSTVAYRPVEAG